MRTSFLAPGGQINPSAANRVLVTGSTSDESDGAPSTGVAPLVADFAAFLRSLESAEVVTHDPAAIAASWPGEIEEDSVTGSQTDEKAVDGQSALSASVFPSEALPFALSLFPQLVITATEPEAQATPFQPLPSQESVAVVEALATSQPVSRPMVEASASISQPASDSAFAAGPAVAPEVRFESALGKAVQSDSVVSDSSQADIAQSDSTPAKSLRPSPSSGAEGKGQSSTSEYQTSTAKTISPATLFPTKVEGAALADWAEITRATESATSKISPREAAPAAPDAQPRATEPTATRTVQEAETPNQSQGQQGRSSRNGGNSASDDSATLAEPARPKVKYATETPIDALKGQEARVASAAASGETVELTAEPSDKAAFENIARQLTERIALRAQALRPGEKVELTLRLHPDELGAVEVRLTSSGDSLKIEILAENGKTRELIESNLAALRSSLVEKGAGGERLALSAGTLAQTSSHSTTSGQGAGGEVVKLADPTRIAQPPGATGQTADSWSQGRSARDGASSFAYSASGPAASGASSSAPGDAGGFLGASSDFNSSGRGGREPGFLPTSVERTNLAADARPETPEPVARLPRIIGRGRGIDYRV